MTPTDPTIRGTAAVFIVVDDTTITHHTASLIAALDAHKRFPMVIHIGNGYGEIDRGLDVGRLMIDRARELMLMKPIRYHHNPYRYPDQPRSASPRRFKKGSKR